jgi:hypothetical protein
VDEILPWLKRAIGKHFPNAPVEAGTVVVLGPLKAKIQKIYDSEINIEISWTGNGPIGVKLGNEFCGFEAEGAATKMSDVLPWLQEQIHKHYPESKYDVGRRGGKWKPKWFGPRDYTMNGKPIDEGGVR